MKGKDTFDIEKFANEVIEQPEVIEKFHQYKREYEEESQIAIDDYFTISESARKKQQRSYKRVIRLDQKIQIVIDGNRENAVRSLNKNSFQFIRMLERIGKGKENKPLYIDKL